MNYFNLEFCLAQFKWVFLLIEVNTMAVGSGTTNVGLKLSTSSFYKYLQVVARIVVIFGPPDHRVVA